MEQLVARQAHNLKVVSSSLTPATRYEKAGLLKARLFCFGDAPAFAL